MSKEDQNKSEKKARAEKREQSKRNAAQEKRTNQ